MLVSTRFTFRFRIRYHHSTRYCGISRYPLCSWRLGHRRLRVRPCSLPPPAPQPAADLCRSLSALLSQLVHRYLCARWYSVTGSIPGQVLYITTFVYASSIDTASLYKFRRLVECDRVIFREQFLPDVLIY